MNDVPGFADRFVLGMAQTALCGGLLAGIATLVGKCLPRMLHGWRAVMWWLVCARFVVGFVCAGFLPPSPALVVIVPPFWVGRLPNAANSPRPTQTSPFPVSDAETKPQTEGVSAPESRPFDDTVPPRPSFSLPLFVVAIWLVGFLVRSAVSAAHYTRLQKRVRVARTLLGDETDAPARALFHAAAKAARQLHRTTMPRLLMSPLPCDPLVTGWREPAVLLSEADTVRLSPHELTLVLLHEMTHLRRRDLLWGMVPHFAIHLFWFWPLAHFACREWGLACEAACDGEAARTAHATPYQYGELLLKLGTAQPPSPFFAALPVSVPFRLLQRRLMMLRLSAVPVSPRRRFLTALGLVLLMPFLPLLFLQPRFAQSNPPLVQPPFPPDPKIDALIALQNPRNAWKVNRDTRKLWSTYPTGPRNLDFTKGLDGWETNEFNVPWGYKVSVQKIKAPTNAPSGLLQRTYQGYLQHQNVSESGLAQYLQPGAFRGKRIRFSGWTKSENVTGADYFFRVNSPLLEREWYDINYLVDTHGWTKRTIVIDVPSDASGLSFGVGLMSGKLWLHGFTFEVVDNHVPVDKPTMTSRLMPSSILPDQATKPH